MSLTLAEKRLRKLARLPGNCVCANCGTTSKVGFSTICIKYHTFVCSNCKTSHQAISHRCKSITMSTWTDAEVDELQQKGNDYARRTWLKHAPPIGSGGRPKKGDHVDVFKRFIVEVYERKRYYGADEGPPPATPQAQTVVSTAVPLSQAPPVARQAPPVRAPVAAPAPAPVADLLDFSAAPQTFNQAAPAFEANFDAFQSSAPASAPSPAASQFGIDFVSSSPIAPASKLADPFATQPTPASSSASGFGFIKPPPAAPADATTPAAAPATASNSAFGFISSASASSANPSNGDFADFSGMTTSTPATTPAPAAKKPIMSNSGSPHASMISSMNIPPRSKPQSNGMDFGLSQPGYGGGMQSQPNMMMMMQPNMMSMNAQQQQMLMMQQQQMMMQQQRMMQQNMMGVNMNNKNGMNSMTMMGGMSNNFNGTNNMMSGNHQQNSMMGFGGGVMGTSNGGNSNQGMNSLDMNMSSMSAWTTGGKN